jgi:anti-sigma regulatory factor (Ser/Thr protein kinase)
MRIAHTVSVASLVRHRIADDLAAQGVAAESIEHVVLVASELVTNAVQHTAPANGTDVTIEWSLDADNVTMQVSDPSPTPPVRRHPGLTEPSGRGMLVIDTLSDDWGVEQTPTGKRIWARIHVLRSGTHPSPA